MPVLNENAALVTLLRNARRPWPVYARLVAEAGSATEILERERGVNSGAPRLFKDDSAINEAAADIARWESDGMQLLTIIDPDYPENLRVLEDRPPLLFVSGRLRPGDARSVAVVGARRAGSTAIARARAIAAHLVRAGYAVVSGLAAGIDTAAHTAALQSGGRTIAVVGTGLRRCYPPENLGLQRQIARAGAVISQFWPEAPPTRRSFPLRNGVISGLTLGTVIIEAAETSGTRIQARRAHEQGRPVFLLEEVLAQRWAQEFAARPGAYVVSDAAEIVATLDAHAELGPVALSNDVA